VDSHDTLVAPTPAHASLPGGSSSVETTRVLGLPNNGEVLGRYRLIERLGAGGFGVVWRAHDELLHREVAVKRIALAPDRGHTHTESADRATREALAAARLAHPAIVALYEARPQEEAFYLISELVDGDTLADLIAEGDLPDEEILRIGIALSDALEHAHQRGVIHRDVKPHNVLVPYATDRPTAPAKLTDFGGASLVGEDALTRTGDVLGTLAYMAPEQSEGHEVTEDADLYSLALVLYEALSGVNPVRGSTPAATARRLGTVLPSLRRYRGDLPGELTRALDLALLPAPADRGTISDLRDALAGGQRRRTPRDIVARAPRQASLVPRRATDDQPEEWRQGQQSMGQQPLELPLSERMVGGLAGGLLVGFAYALLGYSPSVPPGLVGALAGLLLVVLPRSGWTLAVATLILSQLVRGRGGVAVLLAAAVLPTLVLLRRRGPLRSMAALAPVLGLATLAGGFPALAAQLGRWHERAAVGALGYWWLVLAEPLLGRRLWLGGSVGTESGANAHQIIHHAWQGSLSTAAVHVVGPLLGLSVLLGAGAWAVGATVLPWLVRGRNVWLDAVAATAWSACLLALVPLAAHGFANAAPRGAVVGAVLGGLLVVGARALRGPV
jgi:hypothetical protein